MWRCTNCQHVEVAREKPLRCEVCGAQPDRIIAHEVKDIKGAKTVEDLQLSFDAESKAHLRNLAFAYKADLDNYPQLAHLFRAVAEAEGVHAFNSLNLLGALGDTQDNVQAAFERENLAAGKAYPQIIKDANEEGNVAVAAILSNTRDAEKGHAKLYEDALQHMLAEKATEYYVCGVCGYVSDGSLPEECPICGAKKERFRKVM